MDAAIAFLLAQLPNLCSLDLRFQYIKEIDLVGAAANQLTKLDWEFLHTDDDTARENSDCLTHHATAGLDIIVDSLLPVRDTLVDLTIRADVRMIAEHNFQLSVVEVRGSLARIVK